MQSSDFINASSYVRVLEKKLITNSGIDRAVDAPGAMEALRVLSQNSDYNFASLSRAEDYEVLLKSELKRVYSVAYGITVHRQVIDVLACKYDYHNVKAAIKERFHKGRTPPPYFNVTDIPSTLVEAAAMGPGESALKSDLPAHLVSAVANAKAVFEKTGNPQSIDISADLDMFSHMLELCGEINSETVTNHVKAQIDFYNVKTLLRAKNMQKGSAFLAECLAPGGMTDSAFFIANYNKTPSAMVPTFYYKIFGEAMKKGVEEYEKIGNFSSLEKLFDNYLIERVKGSKYITFGPEILYAYLFSKENEIRQIRILVTGKQNGVSAEALKERLRENYA